METATAIVTLIAILASVGSLALSLWTIHLMDEADRRREEADAEIVRRLLTRGE